VKHSFYARPVLEVARDLIGCVVTHGETSGLIVETEAYHDSEPASHAFVGLLMRSRRRMDSVRGLCSGPGKLTQALGIELEHNGCDLELGPVVFSERPAGWRDVGVDVDTRIGITKAAELPWRFVAAGNRFVSRRVPGALRAG
jgi:DNA-3-methyladenine glycosylase